VALEDACHAPDDRAFGCTKEQPKPRGATVGDATFGSTTTKAKRENPKSLERRPESREATRKGAKRRRPQRRDGARAEVVSSEAIPMALSGEAAKAFGGEEKRREAAPLLESSTECTAVIPLSCVEYCNITLLPREYSKILAVRGSNGILARE